MNKNSLTDLTAHQLRQAAEIKDRIDALQRELEQILGTPAIATVTPVAVGKRTMSEATRAKMRASQQARWASKGVAVKAPLAKAAAKPTVNGTSKFNSATRAKIAAKVKAYWAARKGLKSGKPAPVATPTPTRNISAEGRAKLVALAKARWAKVKASGKKTL